MFSKNEYTLLCVVDYYLELASDDIGNQWIHFILHVP